jgi:D-alanyl-D-alanine carboxypeptidase
MKHKFRQTTAALAAVALFVVSVTLALCLTFCGGGNGSGAGSEGGGEGKKPPKNDGSITTSADYTYKTDISAVADALNTTDEVYLLLANKTYLIGGDYIPQNLVSLDTSLTGGKDISLAGNAAKAAEALIVEMRAHGFDGVFITSAYRSYDYQASLYNKYFNNEKAAHPNWTDEEIKAQVLTYSAYPGTSEHQTGLCVDLMTDEMSGLWNYGDETPDNPYDKGFAETAEFKWLKANAHKFGFILRYPEDKTNITGYAYESWHYRFVGIDAATEIFTQGITLEEYLGK